LKYLVGGELRSQYKNKLLGFVWVVLDPLMMMLIYVFLIKVVFERGGPQFVVLLFASLLCWRWFIQSISTSVGTLTSNAKLIQTVKFPLAVFPVSRVVISLFNFLMGLLVLIPMLFFFDAKFSIHLLWLPVILVIQLLFNIGSAMILSIVGVYFRDIQNIILFMARLGFYLSPGLYAVSDIPEQYYNLYMSLNPFAALFVSYKNVLVRGEAPSEYFLIFTALALILFFWGFALYEKKANLITKDL